jgi:hypothetical protein
MATNKIQVKRTAQTGRTPNTSDPNNSQYIYAGELALNMADGVLYTSDGSKLITVGANLANLNVRTINANGSHGTLGQVLASNGSAVYWSNPSTGGSGSINITSTAGNGGLANSFVSGVTAINFDDTTGLHVVDQGGGSVFITTTVFGGGGIFDGGNPFSITSGNPVFDMGGTS